MNQYQSPYMQLPPVVKNLIIINAIMLFATWFLKSKGIELTHILGLYYPESQNFKVHQVITHMFMHGSISHLFFNMFALYMFGRVLESVWGPKRFLFYYFATGIGAAALHTFVNWIEIAPIQKAVVAFANTPTADQFQFIISKFGSDIKNAGFSLPSVIDFANQWSDAPKSTAFEGEAIEFLNKFVQNRMDIPTVGASGAVYGVLLAFGMLFPNTELMLLIPPIPIKAKYFVAIYAVIELVLGFSMPGSNIAHFAHLGGMLFGFLLIKYWNNTTKTFY